MDYAKKVYELSVVKSMMNYFMYQVIKKINLILKSRLEIFIILKMVMIIFLDGKLNTALFETEDELFI